MRILTANAPRRWWLAALLALAGRGVGQLYNGQPAKAVFAYALPLALLLIANHAPTPALAQILLVAYAAVLVWAIADAVGLAIAQRRAYVLRPFNRPLAYAAAIGAVALADVTIVGTFLLRVAAAPEGGMHPAITGGDRVVVDLAAYALEEPARGDIVSFRSPVDDRSQRISRIIGLPGETVEIRDKQVFVDGRALRENWDVHRDPQVLWPSNPSPRDHFGPQRLPADGYFVLDDDRDAGFDSRYWGRPVRRHQIEGRAGVYYFSRKPLGGVRWQRIGMPVHRDVPVPADGPASLYAAMGSGPALASESAMAMALLALGAVGAAPLREVLRRRRHQRIAAEPYSTEPVVPPCGSEAVRTASMAAVTLDTPLTRLRALADLCANAGRHGERAAAGSSRNVDIPVAECLNQLSVARATPAELRAMLPTLDILERRGGVRDTAVRGLLHWRRAAALQRVGRIDDDPETTAAAIAAYDAALVATPAEHAPLRWAAIENDRGTALQQHGEQTGDASAFEQANLAYRRALAKRTRRRAPLDWATTQHNLGNCLRVLGERDRTTDRLLESATAYRAALTRRTRDADPIGHAMTLNNLGITLRLIGARRGDAGPILQAQSLHRESLAMLRSLAPSYAAVPAQNLAEDGDLLRRLGLAAHRSLPVAEPVAA